MPIRLCIPWLINWAVAARRKCPGQKILVLKIDYKLAYCCGTLHFLTTLKTATQLLEDDLAIITLRLTFGGAPCPFEWGVLSELICNLANKLLMSNEWDPLKLHSYVQHKILTQEYLPDKVPFPIKQELIVNVPVDHCGYADTYIDETTSLTANLLGMENANRLEAAILLAIEIAARPNNKHEVIPREPMIAKDKLAAEGGLAETKIILGWHFNFRKLTMTLLEYKYVTCSAKIQQMISMVRTLMKALESMIRQMGHIGFIISCIIS
jgi:hypothetical protein